MKSDKERIRCFNWGERPPAEDVVIDNQLIIYNIASDQYWFDRVDRQIFLYVPVERKYSIRDGHHYILIDMAAKMAHDILLPRSEHLFDVKSLRSKKVKLEFYSIAENPKAITDKTLPNYLRTAIGEPTEVMLENRIKETRELFHFDGWYAEKPFDLHLIHEQQSADTFIIKNKKGNELKLAPNVRTSKNGMRLMPYDDVVVDYNGYVDGKLIDQFSFYAKPKTIEDVESYLDYMLVDSNQEKNQKFKRFWEGL